MTRSREQKKPVFCEAAVYDGDRLFNGTLSYPSRISNADDAAKPYSFLIDYPNGRLDIEAVRVATTAYLSFTAPNDIYVGVFPSGSPPLTLLEQSVYLQLNGKTPGFGNFERTVPGIIARDE